jgi:uncharacterized protein (TIGR00369 family)
MTDLFSRIRQARDDGRLGAFLEAVPYSRFLGLRFETVHGELRGRLAHAPDHVGNARIPAVHGGVVGALLEMTSIATLLATTETSSLPRIINITVEYHRTAHAAETWSRAEITRLGRSLATVRATAWQDDLAHPIAVATSHFLLLE